MKQFSEPLVAALNADMKEIFEERAGIIEFDGKVTREQAEVMALLDLLRRQPAALLGITAIEIELDGGTHWLLTTNIANARRYLLDIGALEIGKRELPDVINEQYGGIAVLTTLG